uniref:homogentisate phytyltransferase 1, chloroplastic-like n=1 Tax=Erigeron canadensis TaxID=72917 RepID=UPI001CB89BBC|nr:homogentisate phytyltransferase 1, chloroplastic-like [Erigeron canadensis]
MASHQCVRSFSTFNSSSKFPAVSTGTRYSFGKCNIEKSYKLTSSFKLREKHRRNDHLYKRFVLFKPSNWKHVPLILGLHVRNNFKSERSTRDSMISSSAMMINILFKFSRPYAVIATVLSVISTSLMAVETLSDLTPLFFIKVLQAIFGGVCMQIYVCGFNQICDLEIDKINKPYLPLASGELTMKTAIFVTSLSAIMSLLIVYMSGSWPLFCGLFVWFVIGTAYSANLLPFLRWKRFPYTAVLYMINSRALAIPFGYYVHIQNAIIRGGVIILSRRHLFSMAMLIVFSVVLILFKDIPDIKGDEMHGIRSLASQIGPELMFWSCLWLLGMAYGVTIFVGATSSSAWSKFVTTFGHIVTFLALWVRAKSVDLKSTTSISSMYLFLWKLFYVEYLLLPLVR